MLDLERLLSCYFTCTVILLDGIISYAAILFFRMRRWTLRFWAELSCWLCWVSWKENWKPRMSSYMPSEWVGNDWTSHSKPWPTTPKLACFSITPLKRMRTNIRRCINRKQPVKTMAQEFFSFLCIFSPTKTPAVPLPSFLDIPAFGVFTTLYIRCVT